MQSVPVAQKRVLTEIRFPLPPPPTHPPEGGGFFFLLQNFYFDKKDIHFYEYLCAEIQFYVSIDF